MSVDTDMPALFVGHGSPANAIEDNEFSRGWKSVAKRIPRPSAILSISAHWYIDRTRVLASERPRTIHDFWGFPEEIYRVRYPAPGSPALAELTSGSIHAATAETDDTWGLDHGTWAVLVHMYPDADIPVYQLSLNYRADSRTHYRIGEDLKFLRKQGVLILGSGNIVHNLGRIDWRHQNEGYPWAEDFDELVRNLVIGREDDKLVDYTRLGPEAALSIPTPDHYWPLLPVLGASEPSEAVTVFNDKCVFGSVSMSCVAIGMSG